MGAAEAVVEDPINQWKQQPTRNRGRASKGKGTTISTAFVSTEKAESEAGRAEARKAEASPILVDPEKSSKGSFRSIQWIRVRGGLNQIQLTQRKCGYSCI